MTKTKAAKTQNPRSNKKRIVVCVLVFLLVAGGTFAALFLLKNSKIEEKIAEITEKVIEKPKYYSRLTGLEIEDESENDTPIYCMQIPNGVDGGRPQVGLNSAGIVYEAIAEGGITRFSAIFQNAKDSMIGPIRSMRPYYIEWDTPFDCTLVHSGSSDEAKEILDSGSWKDLVESNIYMWRHYYNSTPVYTEYYAPNNLFTSGALIDQFNRDSGFTNSNNAKLFKHMKPEEAKESAEKISKNSEITEVDGEEENEESALKNSENTKEYVPEFAITISGYNAFDLSYEYDKETNSYLRSFASGTPHTVYSCREDLERPNPETDCEEERVSPSVVIAMEVYEYTMPHGRESIDANSSGRAYIFQNGTVIEGNWRKSSRESQILFTDENGEEVIFAPGQLWITAMPKSYGKVAW